MAFKRFNHYILRTLQYVYLEFVMVFFQLGTNCGFFSFACLDFSSHSRIFFTHMETSPLPVKECIPCSVLIAIEQWVFSSVPHPPWNGASVYMVISEDPIHSQLMLSVWQWSCHYLFLRLIISMSLLGFEHPAFRMRSDRSNPVHHRRARSVVCFKLRNVL